MNTIGPQEYHSHLLTLPHKYDTSYSTKGGVTDQSCGILDINNIHVSQKYTPEYNSASTGVQQDHKNIYHMQQKLTLPHVY